MTSVLPVAQKHNPRRHPSGEEFHSGWRRGPFRENLQRSVMPNLHPRVSRSGLELASAGLERRVLADRGE